MALMMIMMTMTAQAKTHDWGGRVIDEKGEPMPYVNVVLLSLPDSAARSIAVPVPERNKKQECKRQICFFPLFSVTSQRQTNIMTKRNDYPHRTTARLSLIRWRR